jgi:hypothetical protein
MNEKITTKQRITGALRDDLASCQRRDQDDADWTAKATQEHEGLLSTIKEIRVDEVYNPKAGDALPDLEKRERKIRADLEAAGIRREAHRRKIGELTRLIAQAEEDEHQVMRDVISETLTGLRDRYRPAAEEYAAIFEALSAGVGELARLGGLGQLKVRLPELVGFPQPSHASEAAPGAPFVMMLEKRHDGYQRRIPFLMTKERRAELVAQLLK